MKKQLILPIGISCLLLLLQCSDAQNQTASLRPEKTIPLPAVSGRIDHLDFDRKHQRVLVAALGNNTVEVVDLKGQQVIYSIQNLNEPQGVVFIPGNNSIFVSNGGNGECDVFDAETFQKTASIKLPGDADNVRYDSTARLIYVGYGQGGMAIIDATTFRLIAQIKLSGHPESFQIDQAAERIYVNVPDEEQIEVIDLKTKAVIAQWKITEATSNFPMALDEANHRLFVGCRHAPRLLVMDTRTGKTISSFSIERDVDDIFYNSESNELYLSCGAGSMEVFRQTAAGTFTANGIISTRTGARTSLFIRELKEVIVALPSGVNRGASLVVCRVK